MKVPVVDIIESFSGEGIYKGVQTIILRLAGCNLRCVYCDSKYTFNINNFKKYNVEDIIKVLEKLINERKITLLMITGGEPLLYKSAIKQIIEYFGNNIIINVETNGSIVPEKTDLLVDYAVDIKTPYSGNPTKIETIKKIINNFSTFDVYFKVIYNDTDDLIWIENNFMKTGILDEYDVFFSYVNLDREVVKIPQKYILRIMDMNVKYNAKIKIDTQIHKLIEWDEKEAGSFMYMLE